MLDWGVPGSWTTILCECCCSSEDERVYDPDTRLRVMVLDSGVTVRLATWDGGRISPIEVRVAVTEVGGGGCEQRALYRREDDSLGFLAFLLLSLSLLMTSANALLIDARFRDCRMELRVVGLDFGGVIAAVLDSAGIAK